MANVLFLEKNLRIEKLGIMYLSAVLKQAGHKTQLVQPENANEVANLNPDFIAFSVASVENEYSWAISLSREIKKVYSVRSIFGGPHATFCPEIIKEDSVDFVVQGFGEPVIVDIVEDNLKSGVIKAGLISNMDHVCFPDRGFMYEHNTRLRNNPMKNFIVQRVCPYNCSFCYSSVWKNIFKEERRKFYRRRSVSNVVTEIKEVRTKYPLKKVYFLDDTFTSYGDWLSEFCGRYSSEVGLPFFCLGRAGNIDAKMMNVLTKAGLEGISLGVQTANEQIARRILRRGKIDNEKLEQVIRLASEKGVKVMICMMLGLPVEDPVGDALNSLNFLRKNRKYISSVQAYTFQPYPKLPLTKYCKANGYLSDSNMYGGVARYEDESPLNFSQKEKRMLFRLQRLWSFVVKYDLPITKDLLANDSLDEVLDYQALKVLKWENVRTDYFEI